MMHVVLPHEHGKASPEARRALADARHHRAATEAVLPLAESVRDQVREALDANHFADLMADALAAAAAGR